MCPLTQVTLAFSVNVFTLIEFVILICTCFSFTDCKSGRTGLNYSAAFFVFQFFTPCFKKLIEKIYFLA